MLFGFLSITSCSDQDIISDNNEVQTRSATNDIVSFKDKFVSMSQTVAGGTIQVSNVTVTNKSKLTLSATEAVVINKYFTVDLGSQLEIKAK